MNIKRLLFSKSTLQIVAVVGMLTLFISQRQLFSETYNEIKNVHPIYLVAVPLLFVVNYTLISLYYNFAFSPEYKMTYRQSWGLAAAMNFINQVLPSGGLSGVSLIVYHFKGKVSAATVAVIQIGRYVANALAYSILLPVLMLLAVLGVSGQQGSVGSVFENLNPVTAVIPILFISGLSFVVWLLIVNPKALAVVVRKLLNTTNALLGIGPFKQWQFNVNKLEKSFTSELRAALKYFLTNWKDSLKALSAMFGSVLCEMLILYVSLRALGVSLGPVQLLTAMLVTNLVGVVSVVPGDVGVYEATMIATLALFGVDVATSGAAVLLYRVYAKVIFIVIGYFFFRKLISAKPSTKHPK